MAKEDPIGYRRHFAGLRIFGKISDFDAITQQLGIQPDHTHRRGERRTPTSNPYKQASWQITALVHRDRSLEHHLKWLYRRLIKKTRYLKQLAKIHNVDLYCSYHSDYDQGNLEFPTEVLKWCGELGIPIHVSILVQE